MPITRRPELTERVRTGAVGASLAAAVVFEALTVPETQNETISAVSPWRADPHHTVVSLAGFAVPMLALAITIRFLARRATGRADRARQSVRAAGVMTALVGLTLAVEWAAVITRAPAAPWSTWTSVQVAGLGVTSVLTAAATVLLVRCCGRHNSSGERQSDWLGDVVLLCRRIPGLRRWATPQAVAWVRRRAMTVFVVLSVLAAAAITGAQAVGERVTDPLFLVWLLTAETAANLAFCVISNGVAGFIARPPRTRARRIAETAVVAGCLATVLAIAFHDALWSALGTGQLTTSALAALTLGAGLAAAVVTFATCALATRQLGSVARRRS